MSVELDRVLLVLYSDYTFCLYYSGRPEADSELALMQRTKPDLKEFFSMNVLCTVDDDNKIVGQVVDGSEIQPIKRRRL